MSSDAQVLVANVAAVRTGGIHGIRSERRQWVALGRLLARQESLQVTSCFAFMEASDDSSHIFGMSMIVDAGQVARQGHLKLGA